tara:strand:+ start:505 stop:771 length:267 start_codon:yes stop_codon:yes gene_type:complete
LFDQQGGIGWQIARRCPVDGHQDAPRPVKIDWPRDRFTRQIEQAEQRLIGARPPKRQAGFVGHEDVERAMAQSRIGLAQRQHGAGEVQ